MPWEFLIVPIIAVAVWIIGTLIRGAEQAKGPQEAARRKPEGVTDLDRFLREVHRRRRAEERAQERPRRTEREEEEPPTERPREPAPRAKWTTPRQEEVPVVLPVEEVVPAAPVAAAPVLRVLEAPPLPDLPSEKSVRPLPRRPEPAARVGLRGLLRSPEGLRTAMVLQEVLGPPLSRRRR
jgi:hypothetical protein